MALIDVKKGDSGKQVFTTEGPWSDASGELLCLDTSTWRTEIPVLEDNKCTFCGLCYLFCPPQCIYPHGETFSIKLDYCKGCGICARECPTNAITMVVEGGETDGSS